MQQLDGSGGALRRNQVFGVLFGTVLVLALLPPVYIWAGKQHSSFLGLPFSVVYMFAVSMGVTALCAVLYGVEHARGEVD